MINQCSVLAIIPARGGSKGIPRKNIKSVAGKPLIAWTIEEARKSVYIDRCILSSEDEEIIRVAKDLGCEIPFVRPQELAQDDTLGISPVLHALEELTHYDIVVLLQPTSPLRSVEDIDGCIEKFVHDHTNAVVSVTESDKSPYWMYTIDDHEYMQPIIQQEGFATRRQDLPHAYALNGAVYVAKTEWLINVRSFITKETVAYIMPKERSLDIDTKIDMEICEYFLQRK